MCATTELFDRIVDKNLLVRRLNITANHVVPERDAPGKNGGYERAGTDLKTVDSRLREVQPLIKSISNYQRFKPVYDAFTKAKDKHSFRAKHEAELVIFEAAKSTLLAMQ